MPRRKSRCWPTDTLGQRAACITAVAVVLYTIPAGLALAAERITALAR